MPIDYTISKPTAGTSRSTSPTEVEILTDVSDTIADVGSRLDTLEGGAFDAGHASGEYYGAVVASTSTRSMADGLLMMSPLDIWDSVTIDRIRLEVTTAGTVGAVIRMGLWSDTAGKPGTLLIDAGVVAAETTGYKEIITSVDVAPGRLWIGAVGQGAPATAPVVRSNGGMLRGAPHPHTVDSLATDGWYATGVTGALGSSPAVVGGGSANAPRQLVHIA